MAGFTKKLRQEIVQEFAVRHNGTFNPALFLEEVRRAGAAHPAFEWFEWDQTKAATAFQIEQARDFARDLRVSFTIEDVGGAKNISIKQSMPMVLSPMSGRSKGGGYLLVDTDNPDHISEHCLQAAMALRSWVARYESALNSIGVGASTIERTIKALEAGPTKRKTEAA